MKDILYQFIEGQTHFGTPKGFQMSFGSSMNQNRLLFFKCMHSLQACTASGKELLFFYTPQPMENHRVPTPNENPIELKVDSNSWNLKLFDL